MQEANIITVQIQIKPRAWKVLLCLIRTRQLPANISSFGGIAIIFRKCLSDHVQFVQAIGALTVRVNTEFRHRT